MVAGGALAATLAVLLCRCAVGNDDRPLQLIQADSEEGEGRWEPLGAAEPVPRGSSVRLDMSTGERQILREPPPPELSSEAEEMERVMRSLPEPVRDDRFTKLAKQRLTPAQYEAALRRLWAERQAEIKHAVENMRNEADDIRDNIARLISDASTAEDKVAALNELEWLVQTIDNARDMRTLGGLEAVVLHLNDTDAAVQQAAAHCLGTAVKADSDMQRSAQRLGALGQLEAALAMGGLPCAADSADRAQTCAKSLYALGALLRGSREAQVEAAAADSEGTPALVRMLVELMTSRAGAVHATALTKALALASDLLSERYCDSNGGQVVDVVVMPLADDTEFGASDDNDDKDSSESCTPSPLAPALHKAASLWCPALIHHLPSASAVLERERHAIATARKTLRACQVAAELCSAHWDRDFGEAWRIFGADLATRGQGDEFAADLSVAAMALAEGVKVKQAKEEL